MLPFDTLTWIAALITAFLIGFAKAGILGVGILYVPLLATLMDARESTGFVVPMLIMSDIIAITYWRQHVEWKPLLRIIPPTIMGIVMGFFCLDYVSSRQLMPIIGIIIITMVTLTWWQNLRPLFSQTLPQHWTFAAVMGILAGFTTMVANAAGPVLTIYLLALKFNKKQFVGTVAWFCFLMNLLKFPLSLKLNLITTPSLLTNLTLLPVILLGALLGIYTLNRIPQKTFNSTILTLTLLAALLLITKAAFTS